jgi:preprotein translocase SecE subunit
MAADVVPPPAKENAVMATARGLPGFYQSVMVEMRKVTWPEVPDVRRATVAIIVFVLILGLVIWVMDVVLQQVLVKLIPSLFTGR